MSNEVNTALTTQEADLNMRFEVDQDRLSVNEAINLTEQALLVRLSIGKAKSSAQSEVGKKELAAKHLLRDEKDLSLTIKLFDSEDLKDVNRPIAEANKCYYLFTIPWDDKGWRLLPTVHYQKLKSTLLQAQIEIVSAGMALAQRRDFLESKFRAKHLELADGVEFPSDEQIAAAFTLEFKELPLPSTDDIRLKHCSPEQVNAIAKQAESYIRSKVIGGMNESLEKMVALVSNVAEQCGKPNGKIYDSLIGNIGKQAEAMRAFNFYGNTKVDRILDNIEETIAKFDPQAIRTDAVERECVAREARSVLEDLKNFSLD